MKRRGRPVESPNGSGNGADRKAATVARHSLVLRGLECADWPRRRRLEKDPAAWLRWYLAQAYDREFDKPHHEIIDGALKAHADGSRFVVAAERGIGKSSLLYGLVLYLSLAGLRRFPVYLPWSAQPMKRGLQFWRMALSFNERILADYRWIAAPFAQARGMPQRMAAQRWDASDEWHGVTCGAALQVSEGMIVLPDNRGAIGGSSVNGNPRGLNLPQADGAVLRPDLALVDDPQDRKVSKSVLLVTETCAKIDADIAGLGAAGAAFPLLLSGNCIADGDVMARYLADPLWRPLRVSCIEQWPEGWEDKGPAYKLWSEWWEEYRNPEDGPKAALAYYTEHREVMTAGMRLSAPNAYRDKADAWLPDEFAVAMRQYFQMGHESFMAERQQTPMSPDALAPFTLTVPLICSRADASRGTQEIPKGVRIVEIVASTDINNYGLSTVIVGFANDQTAAVLWYGCYDNGGRGVIDGNSTEAEQSRQLFDALSTHGGQLFGSACKPRAWAIDAGYFGQAVRRYSATAGQRSGLRIMLCRGFDGPKYRPGFKAIGQPREHCHMTEWPQIGVGLAWDSHYWHEVAQRAWLGEVGRPGSCSLYRGNHREFAEQIWRERMLGRGEIGGKTVWTFAQQPGRHDYGDAMAQAYAAVAYLGIGTCGQVRTRRPVETRKCRVPVEG